jgi:hypothetical protein
MRKKYNPPNEVGMSWPYGTRFKAVCSPLRQSDVAKLATVCFINRA